MIRLILGGVGSGKSLSAVRLIVKRHEPVFANFNIYGKINFTRLKMEHIIATQKIEKKEFNQVNWPFWNEMRKKHGNFSLYIDEIHNIMHARRSMSKDNILLSKFFSQIRKVCGESETTDLVCISQEENKVDVDIKNIAQEIIFCKKFFKGEKETLMRHKGGLITKIIKGIYIMQYHFIGPYCLDDYIRFRNGMKTYSFRTLFCANNYLRFYDSHEFITMGENSWI